MAASPETPAKPSQKLERVRKVGRGLRNVGIGAASVVTPLAADVPFASASSLNTPDAAVASLASTFRAGITEQFPNASIPQSVLEKGKKPKDTEQAEGKTKKQAGETTSLTEFEKTVNKFFSQTREDFELKMAKNIFYTYEGDLGYPYALIDNSTFIVTEKRPTLSWIEMRPNERDNFTVLGTPLRIIKVPLTETGETAYVMALGQIYPHEYAERSISFITIHIENSKNDDLNNLQNPFLTTTPIMGEIEGAGRYPVDHTNTEIGNVSIEEFLNTIKSNKNHPALLDLSNSIPDEFWNPNLPRPISEPVADFYGNSQNIINKDPKAFLEALQLAEQRGIAILDANSDLPVWLNGVKNLEELTQYAAITSDVLVFKNSSRLL